MCLRLSEGSVAWGARSTGENCRADAGDRFTCRLGGTGEWPSSKSADSENIIFLGGFWLAPRLRWPRAKPHRKSDRGSFPSDTLSFKEHDEQVHCHVAGKHSARRVTTMNRFVVLSIALCTGAAARADIGPPPGKKLVPVTTVVETVEDYPDYAFFEIRYHSSPGPPPHGDRPGRSHFTSLRRALRSRRPALRAVGELCMRFPVPPQSAFPAGTTSPPKP